MSAFVRIAVAPQGDVLIVAVDLCPARYLDPGRANKYSLDQCARGIRVSDGGSGGWLQNNSLSSCIEMNELPSLLEGAEPQKSCGFDKRGGIVCSTLTVTKASAWDP